MSARDRAVELLVHYFNQALPPVDGYEASDRRAELAGIVDWIIEAADEHTRHTIAIELTRDSAVSQEHRL